MKTASFILTAAALCLAIATPTADAFQHQSGKPANHKRRSSSSRGMKSPGSMEGDCDGSGDAGRRRRFEPALGLGQPYGYHDRATMTSLSVATLNGLPEERTSASPAAAALPRLDVPSVSVGKGGLDAVAGVLSASLLITGNTVGSSMFVLPEAVGGLGMAAGSSLFFGLYLYNLISGLLLADVAINLHESSECEVPSSFKEFVDTALGSEVAGTAMAAASLISNGCFLAFGIVHAGPILADLVPGLGLTPTAGAGAFAALIALCSFTQTNKGLESIANAAVMVLFASLASILLPSVANISDPVGTLLAPGTNPDGFATAAAAAVPLILSSLSFQNIVPSITKLLDFDRTRSFAAIAIGSLLPMLIYLAWSFAVLGGGLDGSVGGGGAGAAAFVAFSASALVGSCVAATMSLAEECESILASVAADPDDDEEVCPVQDRFSIPAVAASLSIPTAVALASAEGGDLTCALHFNGAIITPILYGLLPILLYRSVHEEEAGGGAAGALGGFSLSTSLPQALLGAGTMGALGQEFLRDVTCLVPLTG